MLIWKQVEGPGKLEPKEPPFRVKIAGVETVPMQVRGELEGDMVELRTREGRVVGVATLRKCARGSDRLEYQISPEDLIACLKAGYEPVIDTGVYPVPFYKGAETYRMRVVPDRG